MYNFIIFIYIYFLINNFYNYTFSSVVKFFNFHIFNYTWVYYIIVNFVLIFLVKILSIHNLDSLNKPVEYLVSCIFFFNCLFYYLLINNFIAVIFLFELQSFLIIYMLSTNFFMDINNSTITTLKQNNSNQKSIWYFNSLVYQYWISFVGSLLLIYSILNFFKFTSFNDWLNLESYLFMHINLNNFYNFNRLLYYILVLLLGFLLKLGSFPFFIWKPEFYKNISVENLCIFFTIYTFTNLYFIIIFFSKYFFLLKTYFYLIFYIITLVALILVSLIIFSINDIRSFLGYTSIMHILFIILSIFLKSCYNLLISYFYLFTYIFYFFIFSIFLFFFPTKNNIWNFTDIQYYSKNNFISFGFFFFMLSMAGIPPFLGFFSKFFFISLLIHNEEYLLFFLTLTVSLFLSFFYLLNYRFIGYNIKSLNYNNYPIILKNNYNLLIYYYLFIYFNFLSIFFINDLFLFFNFLSKI